MFIGREYELKNLNTLYEQNQFQFVVVYGRRRVGKTTLLSEFSKDKNSIFFVAEEYNDKMALENFSAKILNHFDMSDFVSSFESWEKAFLFLGKKAKEEPLVVVIDEFPYIANANKSIPSLLQNLIDHHLKDTKLFLIICGSSMSFMEKEVLSYKSPLYGRRTAQFKIEPFDFFESRKFFPKYSIEEQVITYGMVGGIPQYLLKFDDDHNIKENVMNYILNKSSYLYEEPKNLLKQELREPALYNSIIEVISLGASKLNEIATKIGERNDKCAKYLNTLLELQIISKEIPVGEKITSRKSVYKLQDNLFQFWYRFVFSNITLIEQEMTEYIYENKIQPQLNTYLGAVFEDICIQFLIRKNRKQELPFVFEKVGRWWGNNPIQKRQEEIDIVAVEGEAALIAECKWRNELLDLSVVEGLLEKSKLLPYGNEYYLFFSKSGFTQAVLDYAKNKDNILLFTLEDIQI